MNSAQAQSSNWWEQNKAKSTPSAERQVENTTALEQEDNGVNKSARENKDQSTNNDTLVFNSFAIEYGITEFTVSGIDETARGGYFRALIGPSPFHFQGTYYNQAKDFTITEFGIGSISPHQPIQVTSSLTTQRWKIDDHQRSFTKATIGLRAELSPHFSMWAGGGYLWSRKNNIVIDHKGQIIETDIVKTSIGNIGFQILLESNWGILFDLDVLEDLDFDFFRVGMRFNF